MSNVDTDILTPDFTGLLEERMVHLRSILGDKSGQIYSNGMPVRPFELDQNDLAVV